VNYFNKLPGFARSPSGLEWILLKKIPLIFLVSAAIPCTIILNLYLSNKFLNAEQLKVIYQCLGILFSLWFFIGATAIGCVVIIVMKGPAYVADPYELPTESRSLEKHPNL